MYGNLTEIQEDSQTIDVLQSPLDLRYFLVRIFYPCLLIWGIIGNILCLRVLLSKKFIKNSTCQYLAVLAVIDILFIFMRSSKHIYKLFQDTPIFNTSLSICRILTFFSSALAHMASWILVIVSFDRYLIVTSRYRRQNSSVSRVLRSTSILIAVVVLCNLYYFFIQGRTITLNNGRSHRQQIPQLTNNLTDMNDTQIDSLEIMNDLEKQNQTIFMCIPRKNFQQFFGTYVPIFDILLVAVIPFFLLCFTNLRIIIYMMRNHRRMRHHRKRAHRRHQRLTIMLLSVTLAFIGLTCPSVIFICVKKLVLSKPTHKGDDVSDDLSDLIGSNQPLNVQLIIEVCEALWYTKHAMNFILYTLSGQDFRREFIKLFTACFPKRPLQFKKIIKTSSTNNSHTNDSNLIEIPSTFEPYHRKKSKKYLEVSPVHPSTKTTTVVNAD